MMDIYKKKLVDMLLQYKLLTKQQIKDALNIQKKSNMSLQEILFEEGFISEQEMLKFMEKTLQIKRIELSKIEIDSEVLRTFPEYLARKYNVFPVKKDSNKLHLATSDPLNTFVIDEIKMTTDLEIKFLLATRSEIKKTIDQYYTLRDTIQEALWEMREKAQDEKYDSSSIYEQSEETDKAPVVRLVDTLIKQAVKKGASDIHIEPQEKNVRIRYRIDGFLLEVMVSPKKLLPSIIARIKIMAHMDITQTRLPQDGKINLVVDDMHIDIRVSTLPTINGEKIALRILNRNDYIVSLNKLGFSLVQLSLIDQILKYPYGMILVTGPTGSGKTTTLYSMLNAINSPDKNIVTLEDPVEYALSGINQVQINPKTGMTFANGLRSILRQDPNIIMLGEIRDPETAKIAIRAALTGHLVFSTLHTNSTSSAIMRLLDMDVEPYLLASCLVGVIAQRLVRKICPVCKSIYKPSKRDRMYLKIDKEDTLYHGKGCPECNYLGYNGRTVIGEVVCITETHRKLIAKKASSQELDKISYKSHKSLIQSGLDLVKSGVTTTDELMRVVYTISDLHEF